MFAAQDDGHFPCDLPRRRAARLLLCDADERVLLLRHEPPLHVLHWAGPGGGLETGESPEQALRRELAEELALTVELALEPAGEWRHVFPYHGVPLVQHDILFRAHLPDGVTPESVLLGHRRGRTASAGCDGGPLPACKRQKRTCGRRAFATWAARELRGRR